MTAIPGTPQYINTIPIPVFHTTIYAAPILGCIGALIMCLGSVLWLNFRTKKAMAAGEGYGKHPDKTITLPDNVPSTTLSFLPIVLVFVINFMLTNIYFKHPRVLAHYASYGGINGIWSVVVSLAAAIVLLLVIFRKHIKSPKQKVFDGAVGSLLPIFNTACEVGYGGVIKSLSVFAAIKAVIMSVPGPALFSVAVSSTVLAGIVGSASGGSALVIEALGRDFLELAAAHGINPQVLHRIIIMAAGGCDTLPHCGAIITLLSVTKLSHKESYFDIAIVTIAIPLTASFIAIMLGTMGIV